MLQAVSGGGSPTVAEYGHAIAQYQLWAYASRPGVWGIYKKDAELWPCILYKRYLAESNCSTRFCRPLPNRSAKVPFLNCECKGKHYFLIIQIILRFSL